MDTVLPEQALADSRPGFGSYGPGVEFRRPTPNFGQPFARQGWRLIVRNGRRQIVNQTKSIRQRKLHGCSQYRFVFRHGYSCLIKACLRPVPPIISFHGNPGNGQEQTSSKGASGVGHPPLSGTRCDWSATENPPTRGGDTPEASIGGVSGPMRARARAHHTAHSLRSTPQRRPPIRRLATIQSRNRRPVEVGEHAPTGGVGGMHSSFELPGRNVDKRGPAPDTGPLERI